MTDRTELRPAEREVIYAPDRSLDAYYFGFDPTGVPAIDAILSAVAIAGKSCHHTDMWAEDDEWSRWGVGRSLVDVIQCAAYEAANKLDAAEAALARVREMHERWLIHGDGDHPEDCDCGDPRVTVCRLCCTDGEDQHETCAVYHDHGPGRHICPTIAALGGEQS